jgi:RNA polymerase sigma factor (sigma-70 family)
VNWSDKELVALCLKKDAKAEKMLYDRFSGQMFAICLRYMKDRTEAEDVFQDGMIKVFQKLHTWKAEGPLGGWMRMIFIHSALNEIKNYKKMLLSKEENINTVDVALPVVLNEMAEAEIMTLIQNLPVGYRTVFNLFAIEGYSHAEIGKMLNITESTSKTQFLKAKAKLKSLLVAKTEKEELIDID